MSFIARMPKVNIVNRYRGCLIGAAIGDALGMPTENMTRRQILDKFGGRVDKFYPKPNRRLAAGQWTDDTLLTRATVNSLVERKALVPSDLAHKFKLAFQQEPAGGRGFGTTTKTALSRLLKNLSWKEAGAEGEFTAGNGAAMRIAPIALFSYGNLEQLRRNVSMVAGITHKNQEAINGGLAVAYTIAQIINNTFEQNRIMNETVVFLGPSKLSSTLTRVIEILGRPAGDFDNDLAEIGTSGSVLETVGSSFYIFLRNIESFESALITSASCGGDTDTIASIVGAISGAYHGDNAIPNSWINGVEAGDDILNKAEALYRLSHGI